MDVEFGDAWAIEFRLTALTQSVEVFGVALYKDGNNWQAAARPVK